MLTTKQYAPAHGSCRWVGKEVNGMPLLRITTATGTHVYEVEEVFGGAILRRVTATGELVEYRVSTVYQTCTCPDHTSRSGRQCKHIRAVTVALPKL